MNVGISTSVIQRGLTGIAQHLFGLLRGLTACPDRHRFTLFVLDEDLPLFEFARPHATLVPVPEKFRPPLRNIWWHQTILPRLARRHNLDVLHTPSYRRLSVSLPCPAVATIHDLAPFHLKGKYDAWRMFYGRIIARQLARRQAAIVAVSHTTAHDIERFFGIASDRIRTIHNGIDHDRFHPGKHDHPPRAPLERFGLDAPFFLYIARLEHPGKNHVRLIEAFNRFKATTGSTWQLALGGSDWHGADVIHAAIQRSPHAADIRPLGFVPDADLPALYQAAEAFVYPSLFEGFGMPPIEAMACGCPVICSAAGSLGEVARPAARIVDPESVTAICDALTEMASNPTLRTRLSRQGICHAAKFTWERAAAKTLRVYVETAHSGNSPVSVHQ